MEGDISLVIIGILSVGLLGLAGYVLTNGKKNHASGQGQESVLLNELARMRAELLQAATDQRREVDQKLEQVQNRVHQGLSTSNQSLTQQHATVTQSYSDLSTKTADLAAKIADLQATSKQVLGYSAQLENLQNMLKNPKHRGILGEFYLETCLKNVLPPDQYKLQYAFKNGEIVDAVIFANDLVIPIDAKFSLENYNRLSSETTPTERDRLEKVFLNDLKERIKETAKYVRPEEGTSDFAFMFIPHEAIYYDLLINKIGQQADETDSILARAFNTYRVIAVSPTSFYAYLQTVLFGLRALRIEKETKVIQKQVSVLGKHFRAYSDYHDKLGKHLATTQNHYSASQNELKKIDKDVAKITNSDLVEIIETTELPLIG
ncbi:MAG: DNA recombination protein RmuC [Patescibacteria group bacterium]